jgi:inorganic phosphate transporter, PiT family
MDIGVFSSRWALATSVLALAFGFSNAFRDTSTIAASVVSTRALTPATAFGLCALFEFLGASFLGSRVARTVTQEVMGNPAPLPADVLVVLASGVAAAFAWGVVSWWRAWPTSNSQSLIGALAGAGAAVWGAGALLEWKKIAVFMALILSPTLGFLISLGLTSFMRWVGGWVTTSARPRLQALHVLGCLFVSAAHGSNNAQLIFAVLVATIAAAGGFPMDAAPMRYRLLVGCVLAAGSLLGGRRLLHKLGMKFYPIRDVQGLAAQTSAAITLVGCLAAGLPTSPTQLISGSIVGAGAAKSVRSVRWPVVGEIVLSWIITMPVNAALGAMFVTLLKER